MKALRENSQEESNWYYYFFWKIIYSFIDKDMLNPYNRVVRKIRYNMRPWRNRQTRTFEGRVGDRTGSSPVGRTILKCWNRLVPAFFITREISLKTGDDHEQHRILRAATAEFF